jgi:hypothetical protein
MKLAIMQPYFFPYIGYFQLMNYVDEFVIYDNIEYTKRGWINRNRILVNGKDEFISIPLKKDSDFLNINERYLADNWNNSRNKLFNKIKENYKRAPFFKDIFPLIERVLTNHETNLFSFLSESLIELKSYLEIETSIVHSSKIDIDSKLKRDKKVLAICKTCGAEQYINPIGGVELYDKATFLANDIELFFIKTHDIVYKQYDNNFIPNLSIIDIMMFNSKEKIKYFLNNSFDIIAQ